MGFNRIGVSASTKKINKATARNAFKRLVMDFLGGAFEEKEVNPGVDLLIMPSAPIIKLDPEKNDQIKEDLRETITLLNKRK